MGSSAYVGLIKNSLSSLSQFLANLVNRATENTINFKVHDKQTTVVGLVFIIFGTQIYFWQKYSFWSRRNVKTPKPIPFFGNFLSFLRHPRQYLDLNWPKKYGKIYGYYIGTMPYLVCADAEVMKKICIKDFDKFPNRYFVGARNKYQKHFLVLQEDDHWRGMRAIMTPTFTSGKIKIMFKLMDLCSDNLVKKYRKSIEKLNDPVTIDSQGLFRAFSMSSAVSCFYGISLDSSEALANGQKVPTASDAQVNTNENFARMSQQVFRISIPRFIFVQILPGLMTLFNIPLVSERYMGFFAEKSRKIIEHRRKSTRRHDDYLQLLLDAGSSSSNGSKDLATSDKHEQHHALITEDTLIDPKSKMDVEDNGGINKWRPSRMRLTEDEINCQTMSLMMVATETTSTLLTNTTYLLAHFPKVQQKLAEELSKIMILDEDKNIRFEYEQLTSCLYLDCVVSESLRLMPPALSMDRVAKEDYNIGCGYDVHVPKGTVIQLAYFSIHMNPEYWPEPEKFKPERFMPENKAKIIPGSYCPFGEGPRHCIGFRFALTEAKIALAKLVSEFVIEKPLNSKYPPEPKYFTFIINENKHLSVAISRRRSLV